jgi:hypothetical protein
MGTATASASIERLIIRFSLYIRISLSTVAAAVEIGAAILRASAEVIDEAGARNAT